MELLTSALFISVVIHFRVIYLLYREREKTRSTEKQINYVRYCIENEIQEMEKEYPFLKKEIHESNQSIH